MAEYTPEEDVRQLLKTLNRQYNQYIKVKVMMKNNLIALLDQTFPDVNQLLKSPVRKDGHEKWVDFAAAFWHCKCVGGTSENAFKDRYAKWCKKHRYNYSDGKAVEIYAKSRECVSTLPKNDTAKLLVTQAISQLNTVAETLATIMNEMHRLTIMDMYGVGPTLGPQLMAEIGDVRRFYAKKALIAFAGLDAPPYQSCAFESKSRNMSKRGSASLRKTLFQVISVILQNSPPDEPVFRYLDMKRAEGKHYGVYMMAAANKFLRIYYARVKESLTSVDTVA